MLLFHMIVERAVRFEGFITNMTFLRLLYVPRSGSSITRRLPDCAAGPRGSFTDLEMLLESCNPFTHSAAVRAQEADQFRARSKW